MDITNTGCAIWLGDAATTMVSAAYDKYTQFATNAYGLATQAVGDLQRFNVAPVQFGVGFDFDAAVTGYVRPAAPPAPPDMAYRAPAPLAAPPVSRLGTVALDAAPAGPANPAPTIREYVEPGELVAQAPTVTLDLQPVPVVVRPDYVLPTVPTLAELQLPDAPVLHLPDFDARKPDTAVELPLEDFSFTAEQYTSALLDKVRGRTSAMLDGGTGLPAAVAQALRDRAYSALDVQEQRAVQQAVEEYAARGFDEPSGILKRRVSEVRQNNQNQRNAASRDIYIQEEQSAIENLRFAVTQGVALESQLFQGHNDYMRVSLEAAQATQTMRLRVFDARVSLAQLNLSVYQTEAQVWRERLQGELSQLEVYRAQLQALQVRGELNAQQVQLYEGQLRGVAQLADLYRTDIEAARLVVATNQQQVDMERSRIAMYGEQVGAYRATWDAYRSRLETNTVRANVYQLVEQGYATRLRAWGDTQQNKIAVQRLGIEQADLDLRAWRGQLDRSVADMQAETQRLSALEGIYRSQVAAYSATAQVEVAASDANARKLQLGIERERARTDVALKNAEISINQLVELSRLIVTVKQGIATVSAQLSASSMSAVNFSAGVHSGRSQSQSCSTGFSYSGSLDDQPI